MKHNLRISVSKKPKYGGVVSCRTVSVRERILRFLFGNPMRLTIVVPGDSVPPGVFYRLPMIAELPNLFPAVSIRNDATICSDLPRKWRDLTGDSLQFPGNISVPWLQIFLSSIH